jgi:type IV pilus assembly protein PilB
LADEYCVLGLQISPDRILVATPDATNVFALDAVRDRTGRRVEAVEVEEEELRRAIDHYYAALARDRIQLTTTAKSLTAPVQEQGLPTVDRELLQILDQAPVVRVVEQLITDAVRMGASDIHLEPRADRLQVRFRVDGRLMTYANLPKSLQQATISRIKILAGEDIAETRLPQDGRFATEVDDRPIDLRVSTLPTYWGEKAVLRILDKGRVFVSLTQLGFRPDMLEQYEKLLHMPQGMILVTGPTGSGKSTTLYASLHTINDEAKNITTVEDPIEYEIEGVNHTQVNPAIDLDFARCLRHILRQDPDIILVGEIRDLETAEMAFRAAMTGHLVLSTLHTNDAPSAATRLVDMGVPPYIIASCLAGVLAQRLVRRICPRCREQVKPTEAELEQLQLTREQAERIRFHRGRGCQYCRNTGYHGRVALYELMVMNDEIRNAITAGANASQLRQIAIRTGMKTLKHDGLVKIHNGVTSAAEVMSVLFAADVL